MRYPPQHRDATRQRVLEASGRQFRARGFGGVGVESLSKAADVTSGAFYNHFKSKAGAFTAVVSAGVERLRLGVAQIRQGAGKNWLGAFSSYYLGRAHRDDIAGGCALPSLSADVARADEATRAAYQTELLKVADLIAEGLGEGASREAAWPVLAQLAGGVILARAVRDPKLADEIAEAVRGAVAKAAN